MSESLSKDRGRRDPIFHKLIYTSSSKLPSLISKVSGAPSEKRVHLCRKHVWSEASGTSGGGRGPSNDCEHFLHWQSDQQFLVLPRLPKPVNCKKSKQPGAKLHPWRKAIPGPESQGVSQEPGAKSSYFFECLLPHMSGETFHMIYIKMNTAVPLDGRVL